MTPSLSDGQGPQPIVSIQQASVRFDLPRRRFFGARDAHMSLREVSLDLGTDETVGLVGESGSGKSTLARVMAGLRTPTDGRALYEGHNIAALDRARMRVFRQDVQMVFQNPYSSLDPRLRAASIVEQPLLSLGWEGDPRARALELLEAVGLPSNAADKFPHEFSGGQRQRIAIARAIAPRPRLLIADEPVSALDVSVQAQILRLLIELQAERGLSILLVSHDLAVVSQIADRVAVMNEGELVEVQSMTEVFENPQHSYTRQLLEASEHASTLPGRTQTFTDHGARRDAR